MLPIVGRWPPPVRPSSAGPRLGSSSQIWTSADISTKGNRCPRGGGDTSTPDLGIRGCSPTGVRKEGDP